MFKHFLAALAAACLLLVVLWAFGAGVPIPKPIGWAVLLALALWASWPVLRYGRRRILAVLGLGFLALSLSACATADLASVIKASDDNPECFKAVHATVTPVMLFGWAVPLIGGTYDKVCHADKAPKPAPVVVGTLVGRQGTPNP